MKKLSKMPNKGGLVWSLGLSLVEYESLLVSQPRSSLNSFFLGFYLGYITRPWLIKSLASLPFLKIKMLAGWGEKAYHCNWITIKINKKERERIKMLPNETPCVPKLGKAKTQNIRDVSLSLERPKLRTSGFGVRKGLLIKKVPAEKMGDLMVLKSILRKHRVQACSMSK